ncbi:MAG: hypothetical protein PHO32_02540 [Candidatus Cloacimonetes bacterium]|nr:hypothetical protein [Candidatus Cloacimonadota bacterium]
MKEVNPDVAVLIAQAENSLEIIRQNFAFYNGFIANEYKSLGKSTISAMVLSQVFVDFYTCVETFMFRVSQEFENNLKKEQWHKDLLQKMSLLIPNIRPVLLSKTTSQLLSELLQFRHFRRYYFDFDYDWEKLELIERKYIQVQPLLIADFQNFISFLQEI